ncbi:Protein of unknown function DUF2985 [Kalmanozyma brasiliensis GHG001]|uniref:Uncharacterized protein n=1 Tax=Kalmanozyma brasiliensis (strain GHG001) TaxID=1365824 RepID=V5GFI3_KALBG|nr:Protein of unknown function DUF2985 [Kalmanozyma brasiliensis GHG001]EST04787.1 Protein of unknown function DUF2985 [Kalmanozyma brasiliensis GHG001]
MRLRKHRRATVSAPSAPATRPRQTSAASSSSDSSKDQADIELTAVPEARLEERRRAADDAAKLAKAEAFLNSEVRHAPIDAASLRPADPVPTIPTMPGSVTSERGSYLTRLSAQAEASSAKKKGKEDDDDDSMLDAHRHHKGRPCAHGVVRRVAERHHRKVEKREKQRRMERMRRIAALDPLKEAERERGTAKETTFMALIRKYGGMVPGQGGPEDTPERLEESTDSSPSTETSSMDEESAYLVDTLDVVDPGVSAAGHLSNIGNSLIFPNIPGLYDRRPVIDLPSQEVDAGATSTETTLQLESGRVPTRTQQDQDDLHLDAYVHELLTKKQKFARAMQGVWAFLKTPVGVIAGIYGFLVVIGGAALVLFLIGAVDGGKNKDFWIEVFSQFENGLFTIPGVGLIPWRLRDTWRMGWIAYYQHLTWRLRKKQGLPKLADKNDVPSVVAKAHRKRNTSDDDSSDEEEEPKVVLTSDAVLSPQQATHLHTLQTAFAESQSWYRPHETFTHHAFSITAALSITLFNDLNSLFQCLLCGYMWGYATHYRDRPAWSTGTFMPCSFLAGIAAGVTIWKGGERSKKKREVEERLLEAFARDVDERVERARRETQQGPAAGTSGQVESAEKGDGIDLDRLASEITEKQPDTTPS